MSQVNNTIIQVRGRLNLLNIKLWKEPYYLEDIGRIETEMDRLVDDFSENLDISKSLCRLALEELQEGALRKLETRKEYETTGIATFNVRHINQHGTQLIFDVKCDINALGAELCKEIGEKLNVKNSSQIKCIVSGKILDPDKVLLAQGIGNNVQVMVIVSALDDAQGNSKEAMYDRIHKIKMDVETLVDSNRQLIEMEDQDGKPVFLPPNENRALLIGLGFYEKARVFIKREQFDEALLLLLDADEKFSNCNSKFIEMVDNYGLLNLDIVWCYLCLKNVTQLPDANRRLELCEKIFERSYGADLSRVRALKGHDCAERAIILRLNLLKGVVHFHQNLRNEAYNYLELAGSELRKLKVDESLVGTLVEMGYDAGEALLALRCCSSNVERAINFIHEERKKVDDQRKSSEKERRLGRKLQQQNEDNWVNPRSVCTLMEMGFTRELVVEALKRVNGDITRAVELLQNHSDELAENLTPSQDADSAFLQKLKSLGFSEEMARLALETTQNNLERSIDFLLKLYDNEEDLLKAMQRVSENMASSSSARSLSSSSTTSFNTTALADIVLKKATAEMESLKAYERFHQDLPENDNDYLDLPLIHEEQLIAEYMALLQK